MVNELMPQQDGSSPVSMWAMACEDGRCDFKPRKMQRRALLDNDVQFDVLYCGVCHSDLHFAAGHMNGVSETKWPCVPGHELAGVVTAVGSKVSAFKVGDHVGVGCMVDSCHTCSACKRGEEQKCRKQVATYCAVDNGSGRAQTFPPNQGQTLGGYSSKMVCDEQFCIRIPSDYPLEMAGPLMCAAVTVYDPFKKGQVKQGSAVGIVGLGGLGQMAVKIAKALGATVTVISRSASKAAQAKAIGADDFVVSTDKKDMAAHAKSLDLILNSAPGYHNYVAYHPLLKRRGYQVILGLHKGFAAALAVDALTGGRSRVKHSMIGGVANTQEIVDLCAKHKIFPHVKVVPVYELNAIFSKLDSNNDEGIRYVLDIGNTLNEKAVAKCDAPPPRLKKFEGAIEIPAVIRETSWLLLTGKWL
jgi:uncharacterized zinc-type alcohol dehydrogenase-like protein